MIWFVVIILPISALGAACITTLVYRIYVGCAIRQAMTKIEAARAELALLEGLAEFAGMSEPTSYAMPAVGSIWEWQPGNPMAREVVTVKETRGAEDGDTGSVWLAGPSGDRVVSLPDFATGAVPALLRHRR
jgi:hypothetical protein